jgi:FMN phosphatase YigB (HAD superfamily)
MVPGIVQKICPQKHVYNRTVRFATFDASKVRVISLDVTGTIVTHKLPVYETYANCAKWAELPPSISSDSLKEHFKSTYHEALLKYPAFGHRVNMSDKDFWKVFIWDLVEKANSQNPTIAAEDFDRFFRRVYQHYGSPMAYELLPDAASFLEWTSTLRRSQVAAAASAPGNHVVPINGRGSGALSLGVISNTPCRTVDTVLPMMGIHTCFDWFACCRQVGAEKPSSKIFENALKQARHWIPDLKHDQMLHIGDNFAADFCGARAAGLQALFLGKLFTVLLLNL